MNSLVQFDFPSGASMGYHPYMPYYVLRYIGEELVHIGKIHQIRCYRDHEPVYDDDGDMIGVKQVVCKFALNRVEFDVEVVVDPPDVRWCYIFENPDGIDTVVGDSSLLLQ